MSIEQNADEELISFLSSKSTDIFASWMQSNYLCLFSDYQSIFVAYNQLKTDYDKIKQENTSKDTEIQRLTLQIQSTVSISRSPTKETLIDTNTISENTEHNNEEVNTLKNRIKSLENDLKSIKNQCSASTKQITKYQYEIRSLQQQNKNIQFTSNLNAKTIEKHTNLQQMDHIQMKQRYNELSKHHTDNMKCIHSFLNEISNRCAMFLNKYTQNENENIKSNHNTNNNVLISDIEPKLTTSFANLEQFLHNVSMLMLFKESEGLNDNYGMSDIDIAMSGDET